MHIIKNWETIMETLQKYKPVSLLILALCLTVYGCDNNPTDSQAQKNLPVVESERPQTAPPMLNSEASFPVFRQGFNHDLYPWGLGTFDSGLWCGSIEQVKKGTGDIKPSKGRAFAKIQHGKCIEGFRPLTSAPASGPVPDLQVNSIPGNGYVQQIDVYLDPKYPSLIDGPDYGSGTEGIIIPPDNSDGPTYPLPKVNDVVLTYAVSICVLNENGTCPIPDGFRYFPISVTKEDDIMKVANYKVTKAGWYTFRHLFGSDARGNLTVDFELVKDGRTMGSVAIENTLNTNEETSGFKTNNLGNGYSWFPSIADGLMLPIDEFMFKPGN